MSHPHKHFPTSCINSICEIRENPLTPAAAATEFLGDYSGRGEAPWAEAARQPPPAQPRGSVTHSTEQGWRGLPGKRWNFFFYIYIFFPAQLFSALQLTAPPRTGDLAPCRDTAPLCPPCLQHQVMQRETAHHQLVPMEYKRTGQGSSKRIGLRTGMATGGQCWGQWTPRTLPWSPQPKHHSHSRLQPLPRLLQLLRSQSQLSEKRLPLKLSNTMRGKKKKEGIKFKYL